MGKGFFNTGFKYKDNDFIFKNKKIKANFIFNRSDYCFENGFNNNKLITFCKDKRNIIKSLPKYSPKSFYIRNKKILKKRLSEFSKKSRKVIKPVNGSCGNNILITKSNSKIKSYKSYPCLLQKFINTSSGIPNIYKGTHDFRIVLINGEIVYSMYRIPPKNSYISNINKGGTYKRIKINNINNKTINLVKKVDSFLKLFKLRFYSIDIGYTKKGIKLFELNSSPVIPIKINLTKKLHKKLHKLIIKNI